MSITYKTAPAYSTNDLPSAATQSALADAFNDRIRNGLADPCQRIQIYGLNLFRQLRNPDEDGNYPSQYEYSAFYSYFDSGDTYPFNDAGTYEGANEANPAAQQVFGSETQGGNTQGEGDTFNKFSLMTPAGSTARDYWDLGVQQRGGYDPTNGNMYAPFFEMAQSHSMHVFNYWQKYHKSYGGYQPVPQENDSCPCIDEDGFYYRNWQYKWTSLNTTESITFSGSCPPAWTSCDADKFVAYIWRGPYADSVWTYDGTFYYFDKTEWIEGPYEGGGYLDRADGDQINRLMLNPFVLGFKGTATQRVPQCKDIKSIAFSNHEFLSSQYLLAPAYATTVGSEIDVTNPTYTIGTGATLPVGTGTATHYVPEGFVVGGFIVEPSGLVGTTTINAISASVIVGTYTINGTASIHNFTSQSLRELKFELASTANFDSYLGHIDFESTDLYDYKPQHEDLYALLRFSSAASNDDDTLDTVGINESNSKQIYDSYLSYSCALNIHGNTEVYQQTAVINTNPLFDAGRRYWNSITRVVNGEDMLSGDSILLGYEVTDGKSILYLKRYTSNNDDMWAGIINTANPDSNGIVNTANTASWTNEWLMFVNTKCYSPSNSNIFKPDLYSNYFPYINRCALLPSSTDANNSQDLFRFSHEWHPNWPTPRKQEWLSPELLSCYNYDGYLNRIYYTPGDYAGEEWAKAFYKSCQIYQKDYEIESATGYDWEGTESVKLVFTSRFQCHDDAPASISSNIATWNKTAIQNQSYRTDENALQQFLIYKTYDTNATLKRGDSEANNVTAFDPYPRNGAIYPTFYFTKLIPKPYNPNTDITGSCLCSDYTRVAPSADVITQMETYLRAICEGYVDDTVSIEYACATDFNTAFDYTYENLCYDASGGTHRSIPLVGSTLRGDKPKGYGALGNTKLDSEPLNLISNCLNKLTKVRLILPWYLKCKYSYYEGNASIGADVKSDDCSTNAAHYAIFFDYAGPSANTLVSPPTDYWYCDSITAGTELKWKNTNFNPCALGDCDGLLWEMQTLQTKVDYAFQLTDPLAYYAINNDIKELIETPGQAGFFGTFTDIKTFYEAVEYATGGGFDDTTYCINDGVCTPHWLIDANTAYKWITNTQTTQSCAFFTSGQVDPGSTVPVGDVTVGITNCSPSVLSCHRGTCNKAGSRALYIDVKNTRDIILEVPLS